MAYYIYDSDYVYYDFVLNTLYPTFIIAGTKHKSLPYIFTNIISTAVNFITVQNDDKSLKKEPTICHLLVNVCHVLRTPNIYGEKHQC